MHPCKNGIKILWLQGDAFDRCDLSSVVKRMNLQKRRASHWAFSTCAGRRFGTTRISAHRGPGWLSLGCRAHERARNHHRPRERAVGLGEAPRTHFRHEAHEGKYHDGDLEPHRPADECTIPARVRTSVFHCRFRVPGCVNLV
jgi:hypothetical protein